jgi:predicted helicase
VKPSSERRIRLASLYGIATLISWNRNLDQDLRKGRRISLTPELSLRQSQYRPFTRQWAYYQKAVNAMQYRLDALFPRPGLGNIGFSLTGPSSHYEFCTMAASELPDLHLLDSGQFFPRWRYERVDDTGMFDVHEGEVVDGYRRIDNITDEALAAFSTAYPDESISKDDIFHYLYGLLHSPEYRETYAADLKKMLPRIPFAADFRAFAEAGKKLAEVHLGYETVEPYPLEGLEISGPGGEADYGFFAVRNKKMGFGKPTPEQKADGLRADRSVIHYNERIILRGIPEDAYRYTLGNRSAIEWIIDRYWVKTDKASGIVNDPNDWSREVGDPRYILDLLARIVTVSLETIRVVDSLPPLRVHHDSGERHGTQRGGD